MQWQTFWNQWANLLFVALKKRPQVRQQLRTLHIQAALHAAFRWDKARRFTSNDLYDLNTRQRRSPIAGPSLPSMRCGPPGSQQGLMKITAAGANP
jgi:hypothetical protein